MANFINILWALFCQYPFAEILQSQNVTREKLRKALLYEKWAGKMLMKLTLGVLNLFAPWTPKSQKKFH